MEHVLKSLETPCNEMMEYNRGLEKGNGGYFLPVGKKTRASRCGEDEGMARKLWEWSEEQTRSFGL